MADEIPNEEPVPAPFVPPVLRRFARYASGSPRVIGIIGLYSEPGPGSIGAAELWAECPAGFDGEADDYCIQNGQVVARPAMACTLDKPTIAANGTDTATVSGIPVGARVTVTDANGVTVYTVTDAVLQVTADEPGPVDIAVEARPAVPYRVEIVAQ